MKMPTTGPGAQQGNASSVTGEVKKNINGELWQACAGPLVDLPAAGTHVVYFPQGHSEQVAASLKKDVDAQVPNYPNLPSKLLCLLHNITLHADPETDEVYAQMTLQPVPMFDKDSLLRSDLSMRINKPQTEFFCKTLTASDTSTHGGFSVPRRAAEKIFPQLDFTMQPPAQELVARDLHDNVWTFRHIFRGQPKRHLLTTGWSLFVSGKRLFAGDSVLFIRDEKQQLLLGIRRANRQPTNLSSSVLSSDCMHIGILAAAAHAAANNSPFTVFFNPRASPSEFVIPLAKYYKSVSSNPISLGMRFRMLFETEELGTRRYMGTVTGISDLDPVGWKNSQWRNLQVGWDESTTGDRHNRVSVWQIEPVTTPFFICPTPPFFSSKHARQPGMLDNYLSDPDSLFRRTMPWLGDDFGLKDPQALPGLSLVQWMNMQQIPSLANLMQPNYANPLPAGSVLQNLVGTDISQQVGLPSTQIPQQNNLQFNGQRQTLPKLDQSLNPPSSTFNHFSSIVHPMHQLTANFQLPGQSVSSQALPSSQVQSQILQSQSPLHNPNSMQQQQQQQPMVLNHQLQRNLSQNLPPQPSQNLSHSQQKNLMPSVSPDHTNEQLHVSENQTQVQLLQRLHQQQQSAMQLSSKSAQLQDQQKQLLDIPLNLSRYMQSGQVTDTSPVTSSILPQSNAAAQQNARNDGQTNIQLAQQQSKLQQQQQQQCEIILDFPGCSVHDGNTSNSNNNHLSTGNSSLMAGAGGGGQSVVTDDVPSCLTSPSANNCPLMNGRNQHATAFGDDFCQSASALLNSGGLETLPSSATLAGGLQQRADVKPSLTASQAYFNASGTQLDYLDSSSSATSILSQNDAQIPQVNNSISFNSQSMDIQDDLRTNAAFGSKLCNQLGVPMIPDPLIPKSSMGLSKDFPSNLSSGGGLLSSYGNLNKSQPELSSSMVSQSFGVPDMAFNSIDSTINESSFMGGGAWAPTHIPRMRTYTKVYKRGAVGRSIDITRYSGYDKLKQDLARRFGIEGQLEERHRVGWKLVYVDHENDVLLVGDDPWEEFVNCVRFIKILSPQEVQQMSLDGDFGNGMIPNQACSSSDNGMS